MSLLKSSISGLKSYRTFYLSCFRGNVLRLNLGLAEGEERGLGESRGERRGLIDKKSIGEEMNTQLETPQEASTLQYHVLQLDKVLLF